MVPETAGHSCGAHGHIPLAARTRSIHRSIGPMVYDCLTPVFVSSGSAIEFSRFGHQPVSVGDAILIDPNVLFSVVDR